MSCLRVALSSGLVLALAAVGACGGSPPPAPTTATPASSDTPAASADAGASANGKAGGIDAAALEKLTSEEAKSGNCDPESKAALEKLLDQIETNVRAKTEDGKPLKIESFTKRVLALSDAARGVQLTLSGKGTEVHVLAFSPKEVSLDVLAGTSAATTMRSSYKGEVLEGAGTITLPKVGGAVPLEGDSRQIEMKPGAPLEVRMRGQGCAGVVVFSKS
ncbi:MAG: hypothetical protein BGO98_45720 [Myxococcales bacterium 68-20]|nr:hypothetical protein [Myxococcales bacterium]OJY31175.1 MAG: hypothetical protein BGO98_45720 [Myxococcales bacterium 68-20]